MKRTPIIAALLLSTISSAIAQHPSARPRATTSAEQAVQQQDQERIRAQITADSVALRRMAVFDAVVNNADRKGGHVLPMADGHRYGVDHGVSFHTDPKLRTVLWGWAGEALADEELAGLEVVAAALDAELGDALEPHLTPYEIEATRRRTARLLRTSQMPTPRGDWPAIPWPPF